MLERLKQFRVLRFLATISFLSLPYHFILSFLGALRYKFPSRQLIVIGVTGTKGKTTASNLIWHILQTNGHKTGLATTVNFKIGDRELVNEHKQTMLGRFELQKLLRQMVDEGCTHAVVETSSWGITQFRHRFIDYTGAVLTNITPEHIEQHGGFENYRAAKVELFEHITRNAGKHPNAFGAYNLDDKNISYFLKPKVPNKFGYSLKPAGVVPDAKANQEGAVREAFQITSIVLDKDSSSFAINGAKFNLPMTGEFNIANAAAAITACRALGLEMAVIAKALKSSPKIAGRMEVIRKRNRPVVIIDYAHEPASLEAIYHAADIYKPQRKIAILGSAGGGRDIWKREAMGRIAAKNLDVVILTNEDPYDEDPFKIMEDIEVGISKGRQGSKPELYSTIDRREAIRKAFEIATPEDVVICTGKGGEVWMCVADNRKVPWDEKKIAEDMLEEVFKKKARDAAKAKIKK